MIFLNTLYYNCFKGDNNHFLGHFETLLKNSGETAKRLYQEYVIPFVGSYPTPLFVTRQKHKSTQLIGYIKHQNVSRETYKPKSQYKTKENKTMARKRMVTRTVTGTEAEIKVVVISKDEITTIKATVGGEYTDNDKLLKAIKKETETDDLKVLSLISATKIDKCYGMLESEFIKLAKELDPETRKALETEEESDNTEEAPTDTEPVATEEAPKRKRGNK